MDCSKSNSQIDIDQSFEYYLKILPQEIKSIEQKGNEMKKIFQFIKCLSGQFQRVKFEKSQALQMINAYQKQILKYREKDEKEKLLKQGLLKKQKAQLKGTQSKGTQSKIRENTSPINYKVFQSPKTAKNHEVFEIPAKRAPSKKQEPAKIKEKTYIYNQFTTKNLFKAPDKISLGNSSINSVLQCLYQTEYLNQQFERKDSLFSDHFGGQFTKLYISMHGYSKKQRENYNYSCIKRIKIFIEQRDPSFQESRIHEGSEVVKSILNIIDRETNRVVQSKIRQIQYKSQDSDQFLCNKYSRKFRSKSYSLTDIVFSGFKKIAFQCKKCNNVQRLFDKFTMIYLPLMQKSMYLSSLSACLKQFSSRQSLDWYCRKCLKDTPHTKTIEIYRVGKTIIFCLRQLNENNSKIMIPLEIPLKLNLEKQAHFVSQKNYILYAAIVYKGNHDYGHYVAYCYDYRAKCWTECDDSSVAVISEAELLANIKNAYLLFYRLQKPQQQNTQESDQAIQMKYIKTSQSFAQRLSNFSKIKQRSLEVNAGMINIGNSCYLNSALQCLYQTQYWNEELKGKQGSEHGLQSKQFIRQYNMMCAQLQHQRKPFNPSSIKRLIQRQNPIFYGDRLHDSGEVINTILNIIEEQTNSVNKQKFCKIQYQYEEKDQVLFQKYQRNLSYSLIDLIFSGFFKTSYLCNVCQKEKRLFEKFNIVYLPLTKNNIYLSKFTDCLKQQFYSGQNLDWHCSNCMKDTWHTKSMHIYKANKTIIFCLNRFNEDNTKIKTPLEIPLQLDLNQYIKQTHQASERKHILYAAIVHIGEQNSGHYVAYCYDYRVKCWAEYNDSSVKVVSDEKLKKNIRNAYILFYRTLKAQEKQ